MNGSEIMTYAVLGGGVIWTAVQYGIAKGEERREQRIERQRGSEAKALLEFIRMQWKQR